MYSDNAIKQALASSICELIILPTEKCNFRCTYCYEDFKIGQMKPATIERVKKFISIRGKGLKFLSLSWFGGEPLLALDVIYDIAKHAHKQSREQGFRLIGGMSTNGYLLDIETAAKLADLNQVSYQITIDGAENEHDKTRILANGKPTFQRILDNVTRLKHSDLPLNIKFRLHVHQDNLESIKNVYEHLLGLVEDDLRFSFFFHKVSDLGGSPTTRMLNAKDYAHFVRSLVSRAGPRRTSSEVTTDGYICYAAKPNSLVIRANGRINKCTVALSDDINDVGVIDHNGELVFKTEKLQRWFEGFADQTSHILSCPLHALTA